MIQRLPDLHKIVIATALSMTLMLGGVALMLWATTGVLHWLLWAVPLTPAGLAVSFLLWPVAQRLANNRMDVSAAIQHQVDRDLQWFKEIF